MSSLNGDALPIGAMLSGLQLTQVSYLRSMELWGVTLPAIPLRRKLSVIMAIVIAVGLASIVGLSSAILVIPDLNYWPAGSTHIWMNTTAAQLWPSSQDESLVPSYCLQAPNISVTVLPASGMLFPITSLQRTASFPPLSEAFNQCHQIPSN